MRVTGLILAGGQSRRMGQDKAFIELDGKTLLQHVHERLAPQCERILVSSYSNDPRLSEYQVVCDTIAGQLGPLAGILAGLEAAHSTYEWLVTIPVDCPFLPEDLVESLMDAETIKTPLILASSDSQLHYTTGLWHVSLIEPLKKALNDGTRKVQDFTNQYSPIYVDWNTNPIDPFFNINVPDALISAISFLARAAPARSA